MQIIYVKLLNDGPVQCSHHNSCWNQRDISRSTILESLAYRDGLKTFFSFIKLYYGYYHLTVTSIIHTVMKELTQLGLQFKRKKNPFSRTKSFETSFFTYCTKEWNKLSKEIRNIDSVTRFRPSFLNFIRLR